jgi:hypothetical protein
MIDPTVPNGPKTAADVQTQGQSAAPQVPQGQSATAPAGLTAHGVAAATAVVGVPSAALATWAIETYLRPHGAPLPDWVAAAIGSAIATAATYVYHVGSALLSKWLNAKLDEP